jgi:hypothetical protein
MPTCPRDSADETIPKRREQVATRLQRHDCRQRPEHPAPAARHSIQFFQFKFSLLIATTGPQQFLDDQTARFAQLLRQLAQAERWLAEAEPIELHQLGLVDLQRNPRPKSIRL